MPKVRLNPTFVEFRGSVNDLTYRKRHGKIFASVKPDRSSVQPTPAQIAHQERFSAAAAYGKSVMADPTVRALYQQASEERNVPIFAVTIADFMRPPVVKDVDLSAYNGQANDQIKIKAVDDFDVMNVRVAITDDQSGVVVESGDAVETAGLWLYTATTAVSAGATVSVKVVAIDRPGGTAVETRSKTF